MKHFPNDGRRHLASMLTTMALAMLVAGAAAAAAPRIDENELLGLGFRVLVATTEVQQKWVKNMPPGKIRPMQRTGKKYFIYPDAARNQIYVGGPNEYAAYQELHPAANATQAAADTSAAYRVQQDQAMRKATRRDLSDPFLGVSWYDLGY